MTRRSHITLLASAITAGSCVFGKDNETMRELFEASQKDKKGLMLYVKGQAIPGVVVNVSDVFIELRSREYSRIMVKIDSIDAVALS
jgi:hypothetical protein